jgi:hypothetical protein
MSVAREQFNAAVRRVGASHFAESSDIGSASICGRKFLLPRVVGAIGRGNVAYIPGTIAHRVLERVGPTLDLLWKKQASPTDILGEWKSDADDTYGDFESRAEAKGTSVEKYIVAANDRLSGIATILSEYFKDHEPPRKIITEITISNPLTRHEGRIDAIFEYDGRAETVDWKTNVTGSITQYERIQTVSNGMLVNYRYGRGEDDFTNNKLTIFTPEGVHHPVPTQKALDDVRSARKFILDTLAGLHPRNDLPPIFVCNSCSYYDPCRFYMYDKTPDDIKKLLWNRRYRVLRKREKSHLNKFLALELASSELAELGILEQDYSFLSAENGTLTLRKESIGKMFAGDAVRVIGREPGIPLLACISCSGSIGGVRGNEVSVKVFRGKPAELIGLPVSVLRTDVDLSKRELESIDRVHRNAGPFQDLALALIGEATEP